MPFAPTFRAGCHGSVRGKHPEMGCGGKRGRHAVMMIFVVQTKELVDHDHPFAQNLVRGVRRYFFHSQVEIAGAVASPGEDRSIAEATTC